MYDPPPHEGTVARQLFNPTSAGHGLVGVSTSKLRCLRICWQLVSRSHHEALAVLVTQPELLHSSSLGRLLVGGLYKPDVLRALSSRD
jgi:hypothetical protein